ncbi:MAG: response regulator [Proteobacteria bacterium]|nr:response regulator [Pseudomonadota bacterium]
MPRFHKIIITAWIAIVLSLLATVCPGHADQTRLGDKRILYLNSYNTGYAWSDNIITGIRSVLPMDIQNLNFQLEYLDAKRYETASMEEALFAFFKAKFKNDRFDVLMVSDNNALDFALKYRAALFPGTPMVFCGINNYHPSMLQGQTGITGIAETVAFKDNMDIIRHLHPQARQMVVIGGTSVTSRAIVSEIKETIEKRHIDFKFTFITGFQTGKLKLGKPNFLMGLPKDTVIYIVPGGSEEINGTFYNIQEIGTMICESTDLPVYSSWEFMMGTGIVGGKLASGLKQGKRFARLALRILNGVNPDTIPVETTGGHSFVFDDKVLKKFHIDKAYLPKGSRIINEPYNFYRLNRLLVWAIVGVMVLLSGLVVLLIMNMAQKKKANLALENSKKQLQLILDNMPHLVFWQDRELNLVDVNLSFLTFFHIQDKETIIGKDISAVPDLAYTAEESRQLGREVLTTGMPYRAGLLKIQRSNREQLWLEINKIPLLDKKNQVVGVLSTAEDITKKINLEKQLVQAQKMEALGILSGGIAHDFNNILTTIVNSTELAINDVPEESMTRKDLTRVLSAGRRGADLVKQILTFSRPGHVRFKKVNLAGVVADALNLVEASLPGNIDMVQSMGTGDFLCQGDTSQLHQVIMNLCTNAFQAMDGQNGCIHISLRNRVFDRMDHERPDEPKAFNLSPGHYLELTVSDNGPGIPPEIQDKIFDPFFTTKSKNIGTGLGLSMVHGIIKGHNGAISLTSIPFKNTQFTILIPRMEQDGQDDTPNDDGVSIGVGVILFVEDDQEQRESVPRTIEKLGYTVTVAQSAGEAMEIMSHHPEGFDLVITDYDMPKTSGLDLAKHLAKTRPDLPVILVSGRHVEFSLQESPNIKKFIVKPYNQNDLSKGIKEALCPPEQKE